MSVLLMLAMTPALPERSIPSPGETRTFGDWIAGCDNSGFCTAIALEPEPLEHEAARLAVVWHPAPDAAPQVEIAPPAEPGWTIAIDGRPVNAGTRSLSGKAGQRLVRLMARGYRLTVTSAGGAPLQQASLAGLSAALLYIEERQGRLGSPSAIVRPGTRRAAGARALDAALIQPPPTARAAPAIDPARLYREDGCAGLADRTEQPTVARLDSAATLVLVPSRCDNGAYNYGYSVMLADNAGGLRPARLDFPGGMSAEQDGNDLTNASWDAGRRRLIAHPLGRGIGDCGARNEYVWDGRMFRLALREVMPECRGSLRFLPVWRARVTPR